MSGSIDDWEKAAEASIKRFAKTYGAKYRMTKRQASALFEIAVFHALTNWYARRAGIRCEIANRGKDGEFRYLTSPSGNPANFSHMRFQHPSGNFVIRQQVRLQWRSDPRIAFTPDIVVLPEDASINCDRRKEYAGGKRSFYYAYDDEVIAAHECKSLSAFPELLINFIGMLVAGHGWHRNTTRLKHEPNSVHLAPTLFVGGAANWMVLELVKGLTEHYPINVVAQFHTSTKWLLGKSVNLKRSPVGGNLIDPTDGLGVADQRA